MSKKICTWLIPALAGVALVCGQVAVAQQEPDWSKVQIKTTKVSGNIYMLEGQGGNIAASVGEDGIVIVDDQFAPLAETYRSTTPAQRSSHRIMSASASNPVAPPAMAARSKWK